MKNYKITISREFGCNAREITGILASKLGIHMYDKELVDMAADRCDIHTDSFKDFDKFVQKNEDNLTRSFVYGSTTPFYTEEAIRAQCSVIRELANKDESAIFFGRCSDFVLNEYPNVLNVFLYSSFESRLIHMMEAYGLSKKAAENMIKRVDRQRHNYYKYVTGMNRGDRNLKHIMIDVERFGSERTADIIANIVETEFAD